jgi:hypothetical protein
MTEMGSTGVVDHAVGNDDFITDKYRLLKRQIFHMSKFTHLNQIIIDICDDAFAGKPRSYRSGGVRNDANDANP